MVAQTETSCVISSSAAMVSGKLLAAFRQWKHLNIGQCSPEWFLLWSNCSWMQSLADTGKISEAILNNAMLLFIFSGTFVQTSSIDVVFILFIISGNLFASINTEKKFQKNISVGSLSISFIVMRSNLFWTQIMQSEYTYDIIHSQTKDDFYFMSYLNID